MDRAKNEGIAALLDELNHIDPEYVANLKEVNTKRIVRALELWHTSDITITEQNRRSKLKESPYNACYLCLDAHDREILYNRINTRVDQMVDNGLVHEAEQFLKNKGITSAQAIGYKELNPYFNGEKSLNEALDSLKQGTRRYAKRQLTWFRRKENATHIYIDDYKNSEDLLKDVFEIIDKFLKEE